MYERVTPKHASRWKAIGLFLDLHKETLEIIEKDNNKVSQCCNAMLATWIDEDPEHSWEKLENAIAISMEISDESIEKGK